MLNLNATTLKPARVQGSRVNALARSRVSSRSEEGEVRLEAGTREGKRKKGRTRMEVIRRIWGTPGDDRSSPDHFFPLHRFCSQDDSSRSSRRRQREELLPTRRLQSAQTANAEGNARTDLLRVRTSPDLLHTARGRAFGGARERSLSVLDPLLLTAWPPVIVLYPNPFLTFPSFPLSLCHLPSPPGPHQQLSTMASLARSLRPLTRAAAPSSIRTSPVTRPAFARSIPA